MRVVYASASLPMTSYEPLFEFEFVYWILDVGVGRGIADCRMRVSGIADRGNFRSFGFWILGLTSRKA